MTLRTQLAIFVNFNISRGETLPRSKKLYSIFAHGLTNTKYTKLAIFTRSYFPYFTIYRDQTQFAILLNFGCSFKLGRYNFLLQSVRKFGP